MVLSNRKFASFFFLIAQACYGQNVITTFAGTEWLFPGEGRPAIQAPLAGLLGMGVAVDNQGNFYVADADNLMVMKVSPDGILHVVAGNGISGFSGDGGLATNASLFLPTGVALDTQGAIYIAEYGGRVRKVTADGVITTIAGSSSLGYSGDGGPAVGASFSHPYAVAVDKDGTVYIADRDNHRVRKVVNGIITTVAGNGIEDFSGDGGPAANASLDSPYGVAVDSKGNLYIADTFNFVVRKVTPAGIISTVAGGGFSGSDGGAATDSFIYPIGVGVDSADNLYIADLLSARIAKVNSAGIITTVAGSGLKGFSGDGGPATSAAMSFASSVAIDRSGSLYIGDEGVSRIRRVGPDGVISTVAGNGLFRTGGDGGPATSAAMYLPTGLAIDNNGNFYTAEPQRNRVRKITRGGDISAFAGVTEGGAFAGDGGQAKEARLSGPYGLAVDASNNVYITDGLNNRIRKVSPDGVITTIAGTGRIDYTGDGGPATQATLYDPHYMAFDRAGNLYFSEGNNVIRRITPAGIISTVAGNGRKGHAGDGGPAIRAQLNNPYGIAVDGAGNLFIGDYENHRVRKVDTAGVITTVAGIGTPDFSGDGGPAIQAALEHPAGIALDNAGNLYIADESNFRVRKVGPDGIITTIAGTGRSGLVGDGGPAVNARLSVPTAVTVDGAGNVYIADWANSRVRVILNRPPSFQISASGLNLRASSGGAPSAAQPVQLSGTIPGLLFTTTAEGGDWLKIANDKGSMPASIQISADASSLPRGSYLGRVTVAAPDCVPPVRTILVSLLVDAALPAKLGVKPETLTFTLNSGASAAAQSLTVANDGGGQLDFSATAKGGAWLKLSPGSGTATASAASTITVTADPAGLAPGAYSASVSIASPTTGESVTIPVTMTVSAIRQTIRLLQTGLTFTAVAGARAAPLKSFVVQNTGQGTMSWTAAGATLSGGPSWLTVTPRSGSSAGGSDDPPLVEIGADPAGLAAGEYHARVQIVAPGADNSPQTLSVILNVLPAGTDPGPVVEPSGLIFTGAAGGVSPGSQNVFVSNLTAGNTTFGSGRLTLDGKSWFVHLPTDATVTPDRATRVVVQPDLAGLDPGLYRGALTLVFPGGVTRTVNLLFVVTGGAGAGAGLSSKAGPRLEGVCTPTKLAPVFTGLSDSFSVVAGWPNPIEVRVVDDCGILMNDGSVVASFTNGDPPLSLRPSHAGSWTGTWQAHGSANAQLTVTVRAELPDHKAKGTVEATGGLRPNQSFPLITPGSVMSSAALVPEAPIAPGSLISILGSGLANGKLSSQLPAPYDLGGASVLLAGRPLPLLSVADDRIDAVVPFDIPVNTRHQLIVQRGNTTTVPEPVTVTAAGPGIFTGDGTGRGQGRIYKLSADGSRALAEPGAAVKAGDQLLIECTGLGPVDQTIDAGTAAPAAQTTNPVSVTIGGVNAPVSSAGLVAGAAGLYQIRAVVPAGVVAGSGVLVQVTVTGQASPAVTIAVQ